MCIAKVKIHKLPDTDIFWYTLKIRVLNKKITSRYYSDIKTCSLAALDQLTRINKWMNK